MAPLSPGCRHCCCCGGAAGCRVGGRSLLRDPYRKGPPRPFTLIELPPQDLRATHSAFLLRQAAPSFTTNNHWPPTRSVPNGASNNSDLSRLLRA